MSELPWWVNALGACVLLGTAIVCLALLARETGRDAARTIAAAYWMGHGDVEKARRVLRGEKP